MDSSEFEKIPNFAVGISYFWQSFLVKILDPSSCEAAWLGPNILILVFEKKSAIPSTRGFSGPIIKRSIFFFSTKSLIAWKSLISILILLAINAVPAFPGIQ